MKDPQLATREQIFDCLLTEEDRDIMIGLRIADPEVLDADMVKLLRFDIDRLKEAAGSAREQSKQDSVLAAGGVRAGGLSGYWDCYEGDRMTKLLHGILEASIPAALLPYIDRGNWQAVLIRIIPQFNPTLRLFSSDVGASGGPAHGDSPLGFRLPVFLQLVADSLPSTLHIAGADFDRPADLHKPMPQGHCIMQGCLV